jgi:hypothetical protein
VKSRPVRSAQERTRTSKVVTPPAPQAGASANSATWAGGPERRESLGERKDSRSLVARQGVSTSSCRSSAEHTFAGEKKKAGPPKGPRDCLRSRGASRHPRRFRYPRRQEAPQGQLHRCCRRRSRHRRPVHPSCQGGSRGRRHSPSRRRQDRTDYRKL